MPRLTAPILVAAFAIGITLAAVAVLVEQWSRHGRRPRLTATDEPPRAPALVPTSPRRL